MDSRPHKRAFTRREFITEMYRKIFLRGDILKRSAQMLLPKRLSCTQKIGQWPGICWDFRSLLTVYKEHDHWRRFAV